MKLPLGYEKFFMLSYDARSQNNHVEIFEKKILHMLVRDYNILYSKEDEFGNGNFVKLSFYCRPQDAISLAFRMGAYCQTFFGTYAPIDFENPIHRVPDGFPESIQVEFEHQPF